MSIQLQQKFWTHWNAHHRNHHSIDEVPRRQAEIVRAWLEDLGRTDLNLIEVGCGTAWFTPSLLPFGSVTATDLAAELLVPAQSRIPQAGFVAGDFMALDFGPKPFDVVVALEVLSHMADQPGFLAKIAHLLKPGGHLMMATQNRPILERYNRIPPVQPGQLRRWVDKDELRQMLQPQFDVLELYAVTPRANRGIMRLMTSRKANLPVKMLFGNRVERFWEQHGFGWTLMALARKRLLRV